MWVDAQLSWNDDIKKICRRSNSSYFAIFNIIGFFDIKFILHIHYPDFLMKLSLSVLSYNTRDPQAFYLVNVGHSNISN